MKLRDLLYLNKSDRQVLLMFLMLAAIILGGIYFTGNRETKETSERESEELDNGNLTSTVQGDSSLAQQDVKGQESYYCQEEKPVERFPFDPNTADSTALLRLGLRPWQVRNIYKYRAAGGIYRSKKDFARLYGLTVKEYRELEPYIRISKDYLPASTLFSGERQTVDGAQQSASDSMQPKQRYPIKLHEGETIDINLSDTTALKTIPGIGSYYARRIVDYRNRLGGFVSVEQLDEIEGVPSEVKAYMVVSQPHPRQLDINRLSLNELKRHPYINYYQARAIVDYRRLHGPVSSLSDLRLLPEFPSEAIARLEPYVVCE